MAASRQTRADAPFTWAAFAGILLTLGSFVLFLVILVRTQGPTQSDLDRAAERAAATRGEEAMEETAVGTTGFAAGESAERAVTPAELLDADLAELVGTPVLLEVDARQVLTAVSFWVGPGRDLLVVINRDTRSGRERQLGLPSSNDFAELPVSAEGTVMLSGVIAPVPRPEATFSWGLSRPEMERLAARGFYVQVLGIASTEGRSGGLDS